MMTKLIIWDSQELCPESKHATVLWSQFNLNNSIDQISIPELVEKNANLLKARYLEWINDLGLVKVGNLTVIETLRVRKNLSYWWMTPIAEKCNYLKSPQITDAIRMLAFDQWLQSVKAESILLVTKNKLLVDCLELYCKSFKLRFKWQPSLDRVTRVSKVSLIAKLLPNRIKIFIWLTKYICKKLRFRGSSVRAWNKSKAEITFFSYFTNFTQNALVKGKFESNYWANLPKTLIAAEKKTNWLHISVEDLFGPNSNSAKKLIKQFNLNSNDYENHILLDSFLNIKILIKSIAQWNNLQSKLSMAEKSLSCVLSGQVNLWPLFEEEYRKKTKGIGLLENILMLNLFESALSHLPRQNLGVYIFEQQPWELALISTWKSYFHNKLIGMQHASVLFWDMRYFHDSRIYRSTKDLAFPKPDKIAVNGPVAKQTLIDSGYPILDLESTEALRYLYLEKYKHRARSPINNNNMKILVLGDYEIDKTRVQIELLERSLELLSFKPTVVIKLHPACLVYDDGFKEFEVTDKTLDELFLEVDIAFTSAKTTSAVDAYCAGLTVISILDPLTLNLSPLRGVLGIQYVDTPQQLSAAINFSCENYYPSTKRDSYFTFGSNLLRWKTLLQL